MCDCLDLFDAQLKPSGQEVQKAMLLCESDDGRTTIRAVPHMTTRYLGPKGRGAKKPGVVSPTFCPFCGGRYQATEPAPFRLMLCEQEYGPFAQVAG